MAEHDQQRHHGAEQKGQLADHDRGDGPGGEPEPTEPHLRPEVHVDQPDEGPRRRSGTENAEGSGTEERADRREQDAVGQRVVAAEPLGVPEREAERPEGVDAVELGGQIRPVPAGCPGQGGQGRGQQRAADGGAIELIHQLSQAPTWGHAHTHDHARHPTSLAGTGALRVPGTLPGSSRAGSG